MDFEVLDVNSLEQLLINYANERLQQFYVQSSFEREKEVQRRSQNHCGTQRAARHLLQLVLRRLAGGVTS